MSLQSLTPDEASANMRHFLNRLNQHVYGNAAQRYRKAVSVIPAIEGGNGKRLPYHLVIDCPRAELRDGYVQLLTAPCGQREWGST